MNTKMKDVAEHYLAFLQARLCDYFSLFCSPALLTSEKPWGFNLQTLTSAHVFFKIKNYPEQCSNISQWS